MPSRNSPIALFDSGIGGLTVLKAINQVLPDENIVYYADTAHLPYGSKTPEQINGFVDEIAHFLLGEDIKILLMACNTSSALAIDTIRKWYPVPVIGIIEPAISIINANYPKNSKIGVIATPATIKSGAYQKRLSESGYIPFAEPATDLVSAIEGNASEEHINKILNEYLSKLPSDISALILGCTHYPIVSDNIRKILPNGCDIINPAMAQAIAAKKYLEDNGLLSQSRSFEKFFVSGDREQFFANSAKILPVHEDKIYQVSLPLVK